MADTLNLMSPRMWVIFAVVLLIVGWALHQIGARVAPVGTLVKASFGA